MNWVAKLSWLHSLSCEAVPGGTWVFFDDTLANFVEPSEFVDLAESASGHVTERVRAFREVRLLSLKRVVPRQCRHVAEGIMALLSPVMASGGEWVLSSGTLEEVTGRTRGL